MVEHSFDDTRYQDASARILAFKRRLPEPALTTLAREVLTRLHRQTERRIPGFPAPPPGEIDRICRAFLSSDPSEARRIMLRLGADGMPLDHLYLVYLAAAARRLGLWWDTNRIEISDVLLASGRMYATLEAIRSSRRFPEVPWRDQITFAAVPGEQHMLGLRIAADLFREAGWDVQLLLNLDHDELVERLEAETCMVVALAASSPDRVSELARLVVALRITQPALKIMVSGRIVLEAEDQVRLLEPDCIVADVPEALREMERLIAESPRQDAPG